MAKPTSSNEINAWRQFGNLAFYPGFNSQFFYFDWLLSNYDAGRGPEYVAKANEIGEEAKTLLNQDNFLSSDFNDDKALVQRYMKVLEVLKKSIQYERKNEIAYFTQKYQQLKEKFSKEAQNDNPDLKEIFDLLQKAIRGEDFDYGAFMASINILLQGKDNAKAVIQYETKHLNEIHDALYDDKNGLFAARANQIRGLSAAQQLDPAEAAEKIQASQDRLTKKLKVTYLKQGNLVHVRGVASHFKGIMTADVKLAHWITSRIHYIWNTTDFQNIIRQYIIDNNIIQSGNYGSVERKVKEVLINSVQEFAIQNMPKLLSDKYKHYQAKNLIEKFDIAKMIDLRESYKIEGWYDTYAQYGRQIKFFQDYEKLGDAQLSSSALLFEAYDQLIRRVNNTKAKERSEDDRFAVKQLKENDLYKNLEEIRKLIRTIDNIKKQYKKAIDDSDAYFQKHSDGWQTELKDNQGKTVTISITLVNGEPVIEGLNGIQELGSYQNLIGTRDITSKSLSRMTADLKTKANKKVQEALDIIIKAAPQEEANTIVKKLQNALEHMTISVGGPKFSELLTGIQFSSSGGDLSVQWVGSKNSKNDVVTMTLKDPNNSVLEELNLTFNTAVEKNIQKKIDPQIQQIANNFVQDFSARFQDYAAALQTSGSGAKDAKEKRAELSLHKYRELSKAFFRQTKKENEEYKKVLEKHHEAKNSLNEFAKKIKNDDKRAEIKKRIEKLALQQLRDSFFVSTTVKTYNQYMNNIGFLGGSLGSSLFEQLTRIQDIFLEAGLPFDNSDFNWLLGAIINCSPISVIGEKDKHTIEHYLGSMAAFALFDEGGAEVAITHLEEDAQKKIVAPSILHLYKVNDIIVPGSYVLQEVVSELETCIQQINFATESLNRGAGITIINTMSYGALPNSGIDANSEITSLNTKPWDTVKRTAQSNVRLQILFLANMMGIMKNINRAMGNIEMPA